MPFDRILFDRAEDAKAAGLDGTDVLRGPPSRSDPLLLTADREGNTSSPRSSITAPFGRVRAVSPNTSCRDLSNTEQILGSVRAFALACDGCAEHLALANSSITTPEAALVSRRGAPSTAACHRFVQELAAVDLDSPGFKSLRDYLGRTPSPSVHITRRRDTANAGCAGSCDLLGPTSKGSRGPGQRSMRRNTDMSEEVERAFAKFQQGAVRDYRSVSASTPR